jgi:hypothetical protein
MTMQQPKETKENKMDRKKKTNKTGDSRDYYWFTAMPKLCSFGLLHTVTCPYYWYHNKQHSVDVCYWCIAGKQTTIRT